MGGEQPGSQSPSALPSQHFAGAAQFPWELSTECSVGPGDLLFIPAYWWHRVENSVDGVRDGLNVAFNWWLFTDRFLRDQIWPFVQGNFFYESEAWQKVPASGLCVPQPHLDAESASDVEDKFRWPEEPHAPTCSGLVWGSFPGSQVHGRFLARSRPALIIFPDAATLELESPLVVSALNSLKLLLGNDASILDNLLAGDRPLGLVGGMSAAANPSPDDLFPLGAEVLEHLLPCASSAECSEQRRPRVRAARGHAPAKAAKAHTLHWQLRGRTTFRLWAPLPGFRQSISASCAGNRPCPETGLVECEVGPGELLVLPSFWWAATDDETPWTLALQWQVRPHALAESWWEAMQGYAADLRRDPGPNGSASSVPLLREAAKGEIPRQEI